MEYGALTVGMADDLLLHLKAELAAHDLCVESASTLQEANCKLSRKMFHLLITDLEYLRSIEQTSWLEVVRRISFVPLIVLSDTPEDDIGGMVQLGADICVSGKRPYSTVADVAFAQFRRYTEYNHCNDIRGIEAAPFQVGDIYIDPARRIVEVCGKSVDLRPREFSLLLYFMQNPKIILTAEKICENAWGTSGIYERGVGHPIRLLRQAIEPDPKNPIYIETVYRIGYRFTAKRVEKRRTKL